MQTENLIFFHGTSRQSARAILLNGAKESFLEEIGAFDMGREIFEAILKKAGLKKTDAWRLHFAFKFPGLEDSGLWVSAFQGLENPEPNLFEYGHVFVSLNIGNAYRYALGNPYRSEFICAIAEGLQILRQIDASLATRICEDFPEVLSLVTNSDQAVVLEIGGISSHRLRSEKGSEDIKSSIAGYQEMLTYPGVNAPCAFRVKDLSAKDIIAVHDLADWDSEEVHDSFFQPDPKKVLEIRVPPKDWLDRIS